MMNSKIQAVIKFNRREEIRKKIGQYILLILLVLLVVTEIKAIIQPHTIYIEVAQAKVDDNKMIITGDGVIDAPIKALSIEEIVKKEFPEKWGTMMQIINAESKFNTKAQNWNCYYNKNETVVYEQKVAGAHSTSCKTEHRQYAWSVDCGLAQINMLGKVCDQNLFNSELNIKKARELYNKQGFNAWYTYRYAVEHNLPI